MGIMERIEAWIYDAPKLRPLSNLLSRYAIQRWAESGAARPHAFSLWSEKPLPTDPDEAPSVSDYTSWPALTNKAFSGRHLPPAQADYMARLPRLPPRSQGPLELGEVTRLFMRQGKPMEESRSTLLFAFFAQWFTDSLLRTDANDRRKNASTHDIDLCQIYAQSEERCRLLRTLRGDGKLRSQHIEGRGEYLDYLCEPSGRGAWRVKKHYEKLIEPAEFARVAKSFGKRGLGKLYATGLERGNSSVGYLAVSTLFMREHNRLCEELKQRNPGWDDERLFQTARMINIVLLMKLLVEEYINHIVGYKLVRLDRTFAEQKPWYRANWMTLEFNLLYRWHALVPDAMVVAGERYDANDYRNNNELFESLELGELFHDAATQAAGRIELFNAPDFLAQAQYESLRMSRDFKLRSYNDYREHFQLGRLESFAQLNACPRVRGELERLYGEIDDVELLVGLLAERPDGDVLFGKLMQRMVAYDAFTQILSNPLLAKRVYNAETFTEYGLAQIEQTTSLAQLVARNVASRPGRVVAFGMSSAAPLRAGGDRPSDRAANEPYDDVLPLASE